MMETWRAIRTNHVKTISIHTRSVAMSGSIRACSASLSLEDKPYIDCKSQINNYLRRLKHT